jgi:hypothetical protein
VRERALVYQGAGSGAAGRRAAAAVGLRGPGGEVAVLPGRVPEGVRWREVLGAAGGGEEEEEEEKDDGEEQVLCVLCGVSSKRAVGLEAECGACGASVGVCVLTHAALPVALPVAGRRGAWEARVADVDVWRCGGCGAMALMEAAETHVYQYGTCPGCKREVKAGEM